MNDSVASWLDPAATRVLLAVTQGCSCVERGARCDAMWRIGAIRLITTSGCARRTFGRLVTKSLHRSPPRRRRWQPDPDEAQMNFLAHARSLASDEIAAHSSAHELRRLLDALPLEVSGGCTMRVFRAMVAVHGYFWTVAWPRLGRTDSGSVASGPQTYTTRDGSSRHKSDRQSDGNARLLKVRSCSGRRRCRRRRRP